MALFGAQDDVSLLTRMYQVSRKPNELLRGSEIDQLICWWRSTPEGNGTGKIEPLFSESNSDNLSAIKHADTGLEMVFDAHQLIVSMMNLACDKGFFDTEDRRRLNEMVKRMAAGEIWMTSQVTVSSSTAPVEECCSTWQHIANYPASVFEAYPGTGMAKRALQELDSALGNPSSLFLRCPGCTSVFVPRRPDQKVCSSRCRVRLSHRRKRQQEKQLLSL